MSFVSSKEITTLKCDRCGKTYEVTSDRHHVIRKYNLVRCLFKFFRTGNTCEYKGDVDLCDECYEDLEKWLYGRF